MQGYITANEAAVALRCSVDTVRRKLRRGELPGKRDAGGAWYVQEDAVPSVQDDRQAQADALQAEAEALRCELQEARLQAAASVEAVEAVRRLEDHVADLRAQIAHLQTALDQEQRLHAGLQQRLLPEPKPKRWLFWQR